MMGGGSKSRLDLKFALLMALAVALIVLDSNSANLHSTRIAVSVTVKPLFEIAQIPTRLGSHLHVLFEERALLRERNRQLDVENRQLRAELTNLKDAELRNAWLGQLLEASEKYQLPVLSAKPTSIQPQSHGQKIIVDRGSVDHVFLGQAVIDHRGVIGQVTSMTLTESAVTMITDPNHSLSVRIQRNGIKAVVHGHGDPDQLTVSGLRNEQDVREGDILITTGFGERFPVGYPVAEVIAVTRVENTPFAEITAVPLAAHDPGFEVLLVWRNDAIQSGDVPVVTLNDSGQE